MQMTMKWNLLVCLVRAMATYLRQTYLNQKTNDTLMQADIETLPLSLLLFVVVVVVVIVVVAAAVAVPLPVMARKWHTGEQCVKEREKCRSSSKIN